MKNAKSKSPAKHRHPEHHARQIILVGAAFVVVMLIAIGFRQNNDRYAAVYMPRPPAESSAPSDDLHAGACCAEGECLDLTRDECKGSGYVYWPDADLCLTACQVVK